MYHIDVCDINYTILDVYLMLDKYDIHDTVYVPKDNIW